MGEIKDRVSFRGNEAKIDNVDPGALDTHTFIQKSKYIERNGDKIKAIRQKLISYFDHAHY